jgi:hypothetical protein
VAWSSKTNPTVGNVRTRIKAAIDALEGAIVLAEKHGDVKSALMAVRQARAWAIDAERKTHKGGRA